MKVKICGITTLGDALAAAAAGADLIGYNFFPGSARYVTPQLCERIQAGLRGRGVKIGAVGVFVNLQAAVVGEILEGCGLDLAQLHGDEPPEELERLQGRAFKAIRPAKMAEARAAAQRYARAEMRPSLLLDAAVEMAYGGTGQNADLEIARVLAGMYPLLLAGGLRPNNVEGIARAVRPWGVDVASGVESSPGRKDPALLEAFVMAARRAEVN